MSKHDEEIKKVVEALLELYPIEQFKADWEAMSEEERQELEREANLLPERFERLERLLKGTG